MLIAVANGVVASVVGEILSIGVFLCVTRQARRMNDQVSHPLAMEFHRARLGAMRAAIDDLIRRRPPSLLACTDTTAQSSTCARSEHGLKSAPIYQIISQPARYDDLDRMLKPASPVTLVSRPSSGQALIELYQIADTYFVKDGNRRVAEARARGQLFLLAYVTEYQIDGAIGDPADRYARLLLEEHREFHALTGLTQLRPAQQIECTALGSYAELLRQIEALRAELAARLGCAIARHTAVARWYRIHYLPITAALRRHHILEKLPTRCETDLYLWVTNSARRVCAELAPSPSQPSGSPESIVRFIAGLHA